MTEDRYGRQLVLPEIGPEGQRKLGEAAVLIVGLGGLGSVVSTYLAGAGIGKLILADNDVVSLSNLQRQVLYTEDEVGLTKTGCARRRLHAQSSLLDIETVSEGLTSENAHALISCVDVVVDCTDNFGTRYLIDEVCACCSIPWVYGSIGAFGGQTCVFNYKRALHYTDLYPQSDGLVNLAPSPTGVLGPVPAVIGAIQALEVLKIIAGFGDVLDGRLFTIDLLTLNTDIIQI